MKNFLKRRKTLIEDTPYEEPTHPEVVVDDPVLVDLSDGRYDPAVVDRIMEEADREYQEIIGSEAERIYANNIERANRCDMLEELVPGFNDGLAIAAIYEARLCGDDQVAAAHRWDAVAHILAGCGIDMVTSLEIVDGVRERVELEYN